MGLDKTNWSQTIAIQEIGVFDLEQLGVEKRKIWLLRIERTTASFIINILLFLIFISRPLRRLLLCLSRRRRRRRREWRFTFELSSLLAERASQLSTRDSHLASPLLSHPNLAARPRPADFQLTVGYFKASFVKDWLEAGEKVRVRVRVNLQFKLTKTHKESERGT